MKSIIAKFLLNFESFLKYNDKQRLKKVLRVKKQAFYPTVTARQE